MMFKAIVIFLTVCLRNHVSSGNLCLNVQLTVESADQKPDSYYLVKTKTSDNRSECAASCGIHWKCVSFFYHPTTHECRLYSGKISALNLNPETGWTAYEIAVYDLCTSNEGYTFDSETNMCYKVHTNLMTWNQGRSVCQLEGAEMVMLNTPAKKARIEGIVSQDGANEYFLGATDGVTDGEWRWVADNSLISWFNKVEEVSDCFEIEANLVYDDTGCSDQHQKFICEKYL